ncbi:MAG TPA: macro domain-containing protein [Gemmatimonadaceae bacterium]
MIEILRADITTLDVEAIVNAANERLEPGGGVCGAIYRAAGPRLQQFTARIRHCPVGEAVVTPGFDLPARYIIHAVGPVWTGGNNGEARLLQSAYQSAFDIAREDRVNSIAFPAISTGIYGYPKEQAARIAMHMMRHHEHSYERIVACAFDDETRELYERCFELTPPGAKPTEVVLAVVPWREPSSFEIAMMAKLKTMLPQATFEHLERTRNAAVGVEFSNPEIQKIWEAIVEDRIRVLEQWHKQERE